MATRTFHASNVFHVFNLALIRISASATLEGDLGCLVYKDAFPHGCTRARAQCSLTYYQGTGLQFVWEPNHRIARLQRSRHTLSSNLFP